MTKIIGLTGGIGSGKTTVANMFAELDVPVYIADVHAKEVMKSRDVVSQLKTAFGTSIFTDDGLDRKRLAAIVFSDKSKLDTLNGIVHPAVAQDFNRWLKQHDKQHFILREAAILFESGTYKDCDKIITVTAPFETKIERVMQRDSSSRQDVLSRMENQWSDEEKIAKSDYVIDNGDLMQTRVQVEKIFKTLKKL
ncbi:MAG: dephospho-CoA kinase [Flavobacterium sp.]|uniref:dephospho-CoA kinase n=1 Tax=Flavobacterium sp. TaxID=239 RepID=UPI00121832F0|nr:dephospho-CoA kinase [Flavobacterium sp.]RZJ65499.1 MAG: dephospho-CoA kinase [Flavobacterium sp.]